MTNKCFGYVRVSGLGQLDGDGFPRQIAAIKAHAAKNGLKLVKIYKEEGVCGEIETLDRPAWSEMMVALHSNGVKTVIIEKLQRMARSVYVQESAIMDFKKHGFELVSVHEPDLMSNDPERVMFRQIMAVFNQYDKCQTVLRLRAARIRMKARGERCEGRIPFGDASYKPKQGSEPRIAETVVIARMQALRSAGLSYKAIADQLNQEGFTTRYGKAWWDKKIGRASCRERV